MPEPTEGSRKRLWIALALAGIVVIGGAIAGALFATAQTSPTATAVQAASGRKAPAPRVGKATVTVPNLVGLPEFEAVAAAQVSGLRVTIVRLSGLSALHQVVGAVVSQFPSAGMRVARGSVLRLRVAVQIPPKKRGPQHQAKP